MTYTDRVAAELRNGCTHNGRPCYCQVGLSIALRRPVAELFPTDQEDPMTTPARYRKRPVEVEAIQFTGTGDSCTAVTAFFGSPYAGTHRWKSTTNDGGWIITLEGEMEFKPGDWIIRGIKGEFYPCRSDIFEATYEPVAAGQTGPSYRAFLGETPCKDPNCACHPKAVTDPEQLREMATRMLTTANEAEAGQ